MNFKESYKKANDEITGDRALLDKILTTPVKEKKKISPIVYRFASCAAAIILVGAIILMPEMKEKFITEETANASEEAKEEASATILADVAEETEEVYEEAYDGHTSVETETNEKTKTTVKKEKAAETSESVVATENYANEEATNSALTEDGVEAASDETAFSIYSRNEEEDFGKAEGLQGAETSAASEEVQPSESAEPKIKLSSGGSGGGSSARSAAVYDDSEDADVLSVSDIIGHIGINENSLVPLNMTLINSEVSYFEFSPEGNITAYEINMVFEQNDAKLIIRLTDSATPLEFNVAGDAGMISASKTIGKTDIFITAYNLTFEDVENYVNSIA